MDKPKRSMSKWIDAGTIILGIALLAWAQWLADRQIAAESEQEAQELRTERVRENFDSARKKIDADMKVRNEQIMKTVNDTKREQKESLKELVDKY